MGSIIIILYTHTVFRNVKQMNEILLRQWCYELELSHRQRVDIAVYTNGKRIKQYKTTSRTP
jgi:hypothetical protein